MCILLRLYVFMIGTLTRLIPTPVAPDQPSNCVFPVKREHNYSQKLRKQVPEALSSPPLHHFFMFCHVLLPFPSHLHISFQFLRSPRTFLLEYHSYAIDDLFTRARLQWRLSLNYLEMLKCRFNGAESQRKKNSLRNLFKKVLGCKKVYLEKNPLLLFLRCQG